MLTEKGQTLMELVVVVAVIVVVVGALVFATIASLRNANFAKNQAQATKLAQEGIERVRSGRDRNECINNLSSVNSWNGSSANTVCIGAFAIWDYQIDGPSGRCGNPNATPPVYCYFNVTDKGVLNYLTASSDIPSTADTISIFKRVIILSDDANYGVQKKVTSIVRWIDFSGSHDSKLTTILRKIP